MESRGDNTSDKIGGYRILRRLATGGTSDVLLARAEGPHGFGRTVVLKKLLAEYQNDPQFERMFAREAAAYARLSHPSIVKLYDFFSLEGQLVMVIEFVDGLPLSKLRGMLRGIGHSLDDRAAIYVASRVFAALAAAHSARDTETSEFAPVIHRDVNPSNVLIPWDGHVKLADFGIAKVAGVQSETQHGLIKGTYGYMAPEQVRGDGLTVRADVYAGALILWELLARRKAIQRGALPEMEVLRAMAEPHIVSLDILRPDIDPQVREAVRRGLEPVADKRSISAEDMLNVLKASVKSDQGRHALVTAMAMVRPTPASDVDVATETNPGLGAGPKVGDTARDARSPVSPLSDKDVEALARAVVALTPGPPSAPPSEPASLGRLDLEWDIAKLLGSPPPTLASSEAAVPRPGPAPPLRAASTLRMGNPAPLPDGPSLAPTAPPPAGPGKESQVPAWPLSRSGAPPEVTPGQTHGAPPPGPLPVFAPGADHPQGPSASPVPPPLLGPLPQILAVDIPPPPPQMIAATEPLGWLPTEPVPVPGHAPPGPPPAAGMYGQPPSRPPDPRPAPSYAPPPAAPRGGRSRGVLVLAIVLLLASGVIVGAIGWKRTHGGAARSAPTVSAPRSTAIAPEATQAPPPRATPSTPPPASAAGSPSAAPVASSPAASSAPGVTPAADASVAAPSPIARASASAAPTLPLAPATPEATPADAGDAKTGDVKTQGTASGRRIFVDGRVAGQTPDTIHIRCGVHAIRVGSSGKNQSINVPCGGEVSVK